MLLLECQFDRLMAEQGNLLLRTQLDDFGLGHGKRQPFLLGPGQLGDIGKLDDEERQRKTGYPYG
ncbi:hypothetical protein GCM10023333_33030 [Ferrimonas pelagia]|uniref:Uncharacterized protein n=1 Tax=Ferrimonas pelagia TaxID=1177826 RepID=A0ABP9FBX0_9GAMM